MNIYIKWCYTDYFCNRYLIEKKEYEKAIEIYKNLKLKNKLIELPDIVIAATAVANNLKIATLNKKHFDRIEGLIIHNFK